MKDGQPGLVRPLGPQVRHPITAELRHAVIHGAAGRVAGSDHARVRQTEVAAAGALVQSLRLVERREGVQFQVDRPTAAEPMAMTAIGVQVAPRPQRQVRTDVMRVGQGLFLGNGLRVNGGAG